ncbi:hypothetical protein SDC9_57957 [bioreactor metagenome]|uniref:Uncharacterized protein n=1 Tax=bioreactor metagenome TaxID=1076179 RepID=A0A644X6A0_9ZZZZ
MVLRICSRNQAEISGFLSEHLNLLMRRQLLKAEVCRWNHPTLFQKIQLGFMLMGTIQRNLWLLIRVCSGPAHCSTMDMAPGVVWLQILQGNIMWWIGNGAPVVQKLRLILPVPAHPHCTAVMQQTTTLLFQNSARTEHYSGSAAMVEPVMMM